MPGFGPIESSPLFALRSKGRAQVSLQLAQRLRALRLGRNWKRETLAKRAGVSPASLKRFENTGKVSLQNLLKLCHALGRLHEWESLLSPPVATSMAELAAQASKPKLPKRGRR